MCVSQEIFSWCLRIFIGSTAQSDATMALSPNGANSNITCVLFYVICSAFIYTYNWVNSFHTGLIQNFTCEHKQQFWEGCV